MRPWKIPALSQLKENQQQQKRNPRNCERVRSSSTKKILFCFVCLKRPGSWLSPTTACHTPAEIQGLSCLRLCCCCCGGSVETPKIFFGQGHITIMLKSGLTAPITAWHENSLERGCMAPILGGLTVFATFLTFLILLWKKHTKLAVWFPRGCDPACSMGNLAQFMNSNCGNLLFSDSSLWVYQHKLMLIFQHQGRDRDII